MQRKSPPTISYDAESGVAYIALASMKPRAAVHSVPLSALAEEWPEIATIGRFTLDLDSAGRLLGIEVFDPEAALPSELLRQAE